LARLFILQLIGRKIGKEEVMMSPFSSFVDVVLMNAMRGVDYFDLVRQQWSPPKIFMSKFVYSCGESIYLLLIVCMQSIGTINLGYVISNGHHRTLVMPKFVSPLSCGEYNIRCTFYAVILGTNLLGHFLPAKTHEDAHI
jgi:hypothetical protein